MPRSASAAHRFRSQRQLVCFARALLADPEILILDEATSAIDPITEARTQKAMPGLLQGRTSFIVAHRLSTCATPTKCSSWNTDASSNRLASRVTRSSRRVLSPACGGKPGWMQARVRSIRGEWISIGFRSRQCSRCGD
ncbi:MAG: hypothetical protein R3F19_15015 [Verrucomicrobiales bacterium]